MGPRPRANRKRAAAIYGPPSAGVKNAAIIGLNRGMSACLPATDQLPSPRFVNPDSSIASSMRALLDVILIALQLYMWLVIAAAILSWLIAFNVVNTRNQFVAMIGDFLYRLTEPVLRPIRQMLPNLGGIDISPIILFLIIIFIERVIITYIYPNVF
jgi:YggT family protein